MSSSNAPGVHRSSLNGQPLPSGPFAIGREEISYIGSDLSRPECILAERDGRLIVADKRATFTVLSPDGLQRRLGAMQSLPNGMALSRDGILYVANIGDGNLYQVDLASGDATVIMNSFDGRPLGSVNFVYIDTLDRMWVTVSTRTEPRIAALREPVPDGYILLIENGAVRLAVDNLYFTNEVRTSGDESTLYIAETTAGRVSRCAIRGDGTLGPPEPYGPAPLFPGARVDGITFDVAGNLWVTELSRNALVVITPDQEAFIAIENPDGSLFDVPTSLTFGGPDLRTAYIGSLSMTRIATFQAAIPGVPLRHWDRRFPPGSGIPATSRGSG